MKNTLNILIFILFLNSSHMYANDPIGWSILKNTIENTNFNQISNLLNRHFDLEVPGATRDYQFSVQPEAAFTVERLENNKFRVKIVDPEALIIRGLIVKYKDIGWNLNKIDIITPILDGVATCLYNVIFSQVGVGELDLSKFDNDYDVNYELFNSESISTVTRAGKGYSIVRVANSSSESKIRLQIRQKNGQSNLTTNWVLIPVCNTGNIQTPPITISPPVISVPETNPADLLEVKIDGITFCEEETGLFCSTLKIRAMNRGNNSIRCNKVWFKMNYEGQTIANESHWIDLVAGQTHIFYVNLKAPYKPSNRWTYGISKEECAYNNPK